MGAKNAKNAAVTRFIQSFLAGQLRIGIVFGAGKGITPVAGFSSWISHGAGSARLFGTGGGRSALASFGLIDGRLRFRQSWDKELDQPYLSGSQIERKRFGVGRNSQDASQRKQDHCKSAAGIEVRVPVPLFPAFSRDTS